jgi:hypothetical protein
MIMWFLSLFLLICCIAFNDLHMLNHPCTPGVTRPNHGVWTFWYTVEFSLSISYWGFLHLNKLKRWFPILGFFLLCPFLVWGCV